jgi:hypothetical protein
MGDRGTLHQKWPRAAKAADRDVKGNRLLYTRPHDHRHGRRENTPGQVHGDIRQDYIEEDDFMPAFLASGQSRPHQP